MNAIFTPEGMGRVIKLRVIFSVILLAILPQILWSQIPTTGDYRSRVAAGNWSTAASWQVRDALGNWTTAVAAPTASNNVYIQGGHTITLTAGGDCNSLHIYYNTGARGTLIVGTYVLNINGKIRSYDGTVVTSAVDGVFYSSQAGVGTIPENLIQSSTGKIKFVGNTRDITDAGAWGTYGTAFAVEFALTAGQTGTLNTGFKAKDILFSSGTINTLANRMGPDNGSADQGNLTINSGATLITGDDIKRTASSRAGTLTINAGGTLKLTAIAPVISFTSVSIDPASNINYGGDVDNQNFASFPNSGALITTYGNVILEGVGPSTFSNKWMNRTGIVIKGNLTINNKAILYHSTFPFSLEGNWSSYGPGAYAYSTGSDTIRFAGNAAQTISSPGGIPFKYVAKTGSGTLTQLNNVSFPTINGYLGIENGIWDAGANTLTGSLPSSKLALNNNTGLILGEIGGPSLPNFAGTITFNSNSTLTLNGNGAQILKGGLDYKNLTFDNSTNTTLASNPTSIVGMVTVKNNAILDIGNSNGFGNASTNLTMTGGRFRMAGTTGSKPDIDGSYSLTGGIIEFYGSNVTRQNIKGKTAAGSTVINFYKIEVNGTNVGIGLYNIVLTSNALCSFTVKTGATYTMSDMTIAGSASPISLCKLVVETGGLFNCGNNQGFHGYTQLGLNSSSINSNIVATNITLDPGSTVAYIKDGDQPITNTKEYQNLIIAGNSGTKTAPAGTLTVDGNFTKTGNSIFAHNGGEVEMKNTGIAQNYYCTSATPVTFSTLYNNNTASGLGLNIQNDLNIETKLKFRTNSKLYLQAGNITLKSSATKTANVGQVVGGSSVIDYPGTGRFIVERYLDLGPSGSHGKSWQFLAVPVNGGQTVNDAWQNGQAPMVVGTNGLGTLITNNVAGTGFDMIGGVGPSMKYYLPATNTWAGITGTNIPIYNANGYMLFVRGDRNVSSYSAAATNTVLQTKGKIFTIGTVPNTPPAINVAAGLFQSVGNTYASAIDFSKLVRSNVQAVFYVWDPKLGGAYGLGAYQTFTETSSGSNLYAVTPGGGSYGAPGSINNNIESGQAFFVHSSGPAGTLTFNEGSKVDASQNVYRMANFSSNISQIRTQLVSLLGGETLTDGVSFEFNNSFSNAVDALDALKILNGGENLGIQTQGKTLVVERRANPGNGDTAWFNLSNLHAQEYRLDLIPVHGEQWNVKAYLIDRFLNESTELSVTDTLKYNFSVIASSPGSYAANRFCLVFRKAKKTFEIRDYNATLVSGTIQLKWQEVHSTKETMYKVQASEDGVHFRDVDAIIGKGENGMLAVLPLKRTVPDFYRVVGREDGEWVNSEAKKPDLPPSISIFPNPVNNGVANIALSNLEAGMYQLELIDAAGQIVIRKAIPISLQQKRIQLSVNELGAGTFLLQLKGSREVFSQKLVIVK